MPSLLTPDAAETRFESGGVGMQREPTRLNDSSQYIYMFLDQQHREPQALSLE
jgi:hypothetical protein